MHKFTLLFSFLIFIYSKGNAQQIKINFANNLIDSSINNYQIDTNHCGNMLTFCDDASGNANNAYQFDGNCGMQTDSFSMTNTVYNGFSVSFYMNKNFDSSSIQYGILHFYKGTFLIYALHDSIFMTVTDSLNNDHTYGAPCNIPNNEWFCTVITLTDSGSVDFYFNKVKYHAGTAAFTSLRRECIIGFCYPLYISMDIWDNNFFKGKLDDIRVWNWPSDSVNVDEICNKTMVPAGMSSVEISGTEIYPNPASENVHIDSKEAGEIFIYDMTGRMLLYQQMGIGINTINTGHLPEGNFILILKNSTGVYSTKLQVQ